MIDKEMTPAEKRAAALERFKKSKLQPTEGKGKFGTESMTEKGALAGDKETYTPPAKKVNGASPGLAAILTKRKRDAEAKAK